MRRFVGRAGGFGNAEGRFFATEGTENTEFLKRRRFWVFDVACARNSNKIRNKIYKKFDF